MRIVNGDFKLRVDKETFFVRQRAISIALSF